MEEKQDILKTKDEMGQVAFPFNKNQFADFLASLLGKPQTISKRFEGHFSVDKETIAKLYEIINQRIYQQNDGNLIQFRVTIYYSDNSSITLEGYEHLIHYNEPLPLVVEAIHLTWQYLVKFNGKETPEKQEINVSFVTDTDRPRRYDFEDDPFCIIGSQGLINIRINHTARTWGADIEALLSKHLEKLVNKESKISRILRYNSEGISQVLRVLILLIAITHLFFGVGKLDTSIATNILLTKYFTAGLYLFIIYLFTLLVEFVLDNQRIYAKPSFLLLTSESIKAKEKNERKYRKAWISYSLTIIISIVTGIIANYIFTFLTTK